MSTRVEHAPDDCAVCDGTTTRLIGDWLGARAALQEIERQEHSDIVDAFERRWVWWKGDLYRHCGMAWTSEMVLECASLPPKSRSDMCPTCRSAPVEGPELPRGWPYLPVPDAKVTSGCLVVASGYPGVGRVSRVYPAWGSTYVAVQWFGKSLTTEYRASQLTVVEDCRPAHVQAAWWVSHSARRGLS